MANWSIVGGGLALLLGTGAAGWWYVTSPQGNEVVPVVAPDVAGPKDAPVVVAPKPAAPQVEVVRLNDDGSGIIAGRVSRAGTVRVLLDGAEVASSEPDSTGQFAVFVNLTPSEEPRRLSVAQGGVAGTDVILAPSAVAAVSDDSTQTIETASVAEPSVPASAPDVGTPDQDSAVDSTPGEPIAEPVEREAAPLADTASAPVADDALVSSQQRVTEAPDATDGAGIAAQPSETAVSPTPAEDLTPPGDSRLPVTPDVPEVSDSPAEPPVAQEEAPSVPADQAAPKTGATPNAPVIVAGADGVRVLSQAGPAPSVASVALDSISYDPEGVVGLSGRAGRADRVQIYLDNRPVTVAPVQARGDWAINLPEVSQGVYTLRVDAVAPDGQVVSRIETPFKREAPEDIARVMAEDTEKANFDVAVRTVQPGNTLWAIARETYGDGILYVHVFEANDDLIRDPDLIYPGQIFRLPELPLDSDATRP